MRTALALSLLLALLPPVAAAMGIDVGAAAVDAAVQETEDCAAGLDAELCVASYDRGASRSLGDDRVDATRVVRHASLTLRVPGASPWGTGLDAETVAVEHPVNGALEDAWTALNEARPDPAKPFVEFESRAMPGAAHPGTLFLDVTFPTPLPLPGDAWERSYVPVYSWDCSRYFTDYYQWDDACTHDAVRPLPSGVMSTGSTDTLVALPAYFVACDYYGETVEDACPLLDATRDDALAAASAWSSATPNASFGAAVGEVAAQVEAPDARAAPTHAAGTLARPAAPVLAPGRAPRADPVAVPAASEPKRDVTPPRDAPAQAPPTARPTVLARATAPLAPASRDALVLAAAVAAGVLVLVGAALYHRITRNDALENENRQRILDLIRENPGIRAGTLASRLGLSHPTVAEHLRMLGRFRMVEAAGEGQKRYFVAGAMGPEEKRVAGASSSPVAQALVAHLAQHGAADFGAMCDALGIGRSTASVTLRRLEARGVVSRRREGARVVVSLVAPEAARVALVDKSSA